jgi:hypothetical protein
MLRMNIGIRVAVVALAMGALLEQAQVNSPGRSIVNGAAVEYLFPEQVTVPAGKPTNVTLHFRVADGLHINSHAPKDEFLIPTTFSIPESAGARLDSAIYPPGEEFTLPMDPSTKLSVYKGEFAIQAKIVAPAGDHLVEANLHFQACDKAVCLPPKTITVAFNVVGK